MKKIAIILLILLHTIGFSQNNAKFERIKSLRIAYISDKLQLTTDEAQKFWPIFNAFDAQQMDLRLQKRMIAFRLNPENSQAISEKELSKLLTDSENLEDNLQENRKKFIKNLQGVLPTQKILMLKQIEEDFKRNLLKQIRNR